MCSFIAAIIISAVLTTGTAVVQQKEAKKAQAKANDRADAQRDADQQRQDNLRASTQEATTAKALQSSRAQTSIKKRKGKQQLRAAPVTGIGGIQQAPTGAVGGLTAPAKAKPLGGI